MRKINEIIVHCTATHPEWMADSSVQEKVDEIRRWHVNGNGWSDIGYHAVIDRDGAKAPGRPIQRAGAHTKGHNSNSIGVSLVGGHGSSEQDQPLDNFTQEQLTSLRQYLKDMMTDLPSIKLVSGHNQYAAKACPGFHVPTWYASETQPEARPPAPPEQEVPDQGVWAALIAAILSLFGGKK